MIDREKEYVYTQFALDWLSEEVRNFKQNEKEPFVKCIQRLIDKEFDREILMKKYKNG